MRRWGEGWWCEGWWCEGWWCDGGDDEMHLRRVAFDQLRLYVCEQLGSVDLARVREGREV